MAAASGSRFTFKAAPLKKGTADVRLQFTRKEGTRMGQVGFAELNFQGFGVGRTILHWIEQPCTFLALVMMYVSHLSARIAVVVLVE